MGRGDFRVGSRAALQRVHDADPFDRRFRVACDLYNRAVALGFAEGTRPHTVVQWSRGAAAN
jgi:hypothetical protein